MTMRRRTKSASPAARGKRAFPVNQVTVVRPTRIEPPLVEQFHVAVDRQLKSGFGTYDAALNAALAIKERYPQLQVTIYDTKERRHTPIELSKAAADPRTNLAQRKKTTTTQRQAAGGGR